MTWTGSVECPDCGAPVNSDDTICPYCYSETPRSAPWQSQITCDLKWAYFATGAALALTIVILISDMYFGTRWISQIVDLVPDFSAN